MTQIVAQLCPRFVLMVEDRLVTAKRASWPSEKFDLLANKNVLYWARDAIVCMGFTGAAFIGKLPTDSWIAEKISGINVSERFGARMGPRGQWLDIGQTMRLLESELKKTEVATQESNFELIAAGWQWKGGGTRPLEGPRRPIPTSWSIQKRFGKAFEPMQRLKPDWRSIQRGAQFIAAPEGNLSIAELQALAGKLRGIPPEKFDQIYEQTIVDAIRIVADRNDYVGPNCISILLVPPQVGVVVRVRFFPQEPHLAKVVGPRFEFSECPVAFSPWIIGSEILCKPQVPLGDGWEIQMGPFKVVLSGFNSGAISAMSSQRRPLRPTK